MFKKLLRCCCLFLILGQHTLFAQLAGGNYTINGTLPTGGSNFQTFAAAATALNAGITGSVVIDVVPGAVPYNGQMILTANVGANAAKTVTINGNGSTLINTNTSTSSAITGYTLGLNGTSYVTVNNLNIVAAYSPATATGFTTCIGVRVASGASNNRFYNCTITTPMPPSFTSSSFIYACYAQGGAWAQPGNNSTTGYENKNVLESCTTNGGGNGISMDGNNSVDSGNKVLNCVVRDFFSKGINIPAQDSAVVRNNIIERPNVLNPNAFWGIDLTRSGNTLVEKNTMRHPFGSGVMYPVATARNARGIATALTGDNNRIINNLIYGFEGDGDHLGILLDVSSSTNNTQVYHNTIVLDAPVSIATSNTRGIYCTAAGHDIKNNNVFITRSGSGTKYCLYYTDALVSSNYNNLYINSSGGANGLGFFATGLATLGAWQAAGTWDANSVSIDPLFANPSAGYYVPTDPALDNLGTYVNVNDDILNNVRNQTPPDIGAFEFSLLPCAGAPTQTGIATISKNALCFGGSVDLALTGYAVNPGLTYQWQRTTNLATWAPVGTAGKVSITDTPITPGVITYYRCALSCGSATAYSDTLQVNVSTPFAAGSYTINSALPTFGTNFQNFNDAVAAMSCGIAGHVVFNVVPNSGPYSEQVTLTSTMGTSATKTVTFNGNGNTLIYDPTSTQDRPYTLGFDGADYIRLRGLNVTALSAVSGSTRAYAVHLWNQADNDSFANCNFSVPTSNNNGTRAVFAVGGTASEVSPSSPSKAIGDNLVLYDCTISGGSAGIYLYGFSGDRDTNNKIINCRVKDFNSEGIYAAYQDGLIISGNTIERPDSAVTSAFVGINVADGIASNCLIEKNIIRNARFAGGSAGMYFAADATAGNENKIYNNLIYGFNGNTFGTNYGMYMLTAAYVNIYHNTIVFDDVNSTGGDVQGIRAGSTNDVKNNNIYITQGGAGTKYGLYFGSAATSNYNNVYTSTIVGSSYYGYYNGAQTDISAWRAANGSTPMDLNGMDADPLFANPSAGNYAPTQPVMDNMGTQLAGITTDILGASRSATPDMGAYEFFVPTCSGTPVAGSAVVTHQLCLSQTVNLNLKNNTPAVGLTYQWEKAMSLSGPWTAVNAPAATYGIIDVPTVSGTIYYHCVVSCGAASATSVPDSAIVTPPFPAGTYTINKAQATAGTNFNNFSDAVAAMDCGIAGPVVFDVVPNSGPYNERLVLDSVTGASAVNTITFNGNGNKISYAATSSSDIATIYLNEADFVTLNNLNIEATGATGWGVQLAKNADNDTIKNCTIVITSANTTIYNSGGIALTSNGGVGSGGNSDSVVILNNTITGGYNGVLLVGGLFSGATVLNNNKIIGNTIKDFYATGILLTYTANTLIAVNDISRSARTATTIFAGIQLNVGAVQTKIDANRIHDTHNASTTQTAAYGVYFNSCDATVGLENIVSNNLIYNFTTTTGVHYGLYNVGSDGCRFYHNTVVLDHGASTAGAAAGFYQNTLASNIDIKNNVFYIARSGTGTKHCLYFNTATSTITSNYNVLYKTAGNIGRSGTTDYSTLSAWQGTTGLYDQASTDLNPLFASPATADFSITEPLVTNICLPLSGITTDINNKPRSTVSPDPGAFEDLSPLSIELASISAANVETRNRIDWQTVSEADAASFELERSADGNEFAFLARLAAKGQSNHYTYWDATPLKGANYYRLKLYSKTGEYTYSKVVNAFVEEGNAFTVMASPNPVKDVLTVSISGAKGNNAEVQLMDITGKLLSKQSVTAIETTINMHHLTNGVYFIRYSDEVHVKSLKIIKE